MKRQLLFVLAAGLLLGADDAKGDAKKELALFQGTWRFTSLEIEGKKVPIDMFKDAKLIIKDETFDYVGAGEDAKGTFKIDASKKPKTVDITYTEGPLKGKVLKAIYELDGDTYKICLDPAGNDRPTKFETKEGSPIVLETLKKDK